MTDWKPIDTAPRDGRSVLLRARLRANPPEIGNSLVVVGYWCPYPVERWKTRDGDEDLYATHWAPIPGEEAGQ
jgi:hypothetical protein